MLHNKTAGAKAHDFIDSIGTTKSCPVTNPFMRWLLANCN